MLQKKREFDIYASILVPAKTIFYYEIPGLIKLGRGVNPHPVVIRGGFERKESQKDFSDFLEKLPVMILTNAGK